MNFWQRYIGDIQRKTGHLSCAEMGVYDRLLDHVYATEAPLPDDVESCCRIARAMTRDERKAVESVLGQFFQRDDNGRMNPRAAEEIAKAQPKIEAARTNGAKGGRPKKNPGETHGKPNGFPAETHDEPNSKALQNKILSSSLRSEDNKPRKRAAGSTLESLPPWVDADAWSGFESMRKAIRKPMTDAARRLAVAELAKLRDAGQDPTEVLRQSTFRSWAGLFPVKGESGSSNGADLWKKGVI